MFHFKSLEIMLVRTEEQLVCSFVGEVSMYGATWPQAITGEKKVATAAAFFDDSFLRD
jgi:hypothetical protein